MKKTMITMALILVLAIIISMLSPGISAVETENEKSQNCIETTEDFTAPKTNISNEVVSLRDRYTKHYRYEDGTYVAAQYPSPVHYLDNNEWRQIDNTLILNEEKLSSSGLSTYTNKASDVSLSFPQNFSEGQSIEIAKDKYNFTMNVIGDEDLLNKSTAKVNNDYAIEYSTEDMTDVEKYNDDIITLDNLVSEIIYPSIFEGIDLEYVISSSKVKENIIVNSKKDDYSFKFEINYEGMVPATNEDGSISFYAEERKEPVFSIDAPYMYDAKGEESNEIEMFLEDNILTLTADAEWINKWSREFPVTIDPGVTTASYSASSTYVSYKNKTTNYHPATTLYAGKSLTDTRRTYLKYTLPDLPDNAVINGAEIGLVLNSCSGLFGNSCQYIYFFDLTGKSSWSPSTLTWNNQPLSTAINGPLNANTSIVATFKGNVMPHHVFKFDATKRIKSWYENNSNNGIMVTTSNESSTVQPSFYSYSNSTYKPYITIEYSHNVGYEDYWTYQIKDMGRSGKVLVNTYNGAYLYMHEDASTNGLVFPVSVSHIYNNDGSFLSGRVGNMRFGEGFRLNIIETVSVQNAYNIIYTDSDGTEHNFNSGTSSSLYYYEDDSTVSLSHTSNGYTMNFSDGSSKTFDSSGYLTRITDKNGNQVNINYTDGRITSVIDGAGKTITFSYNSNNFLTSITDFAGRETQYEYSSGTLSKIIYCDSAETRLSSRSSFLYEITDTIGTKTIIDCSGQYYLNNDYTVANYLYTNQQNSNSIAESYTLTFNGTNTKITDNNGDYVDITFDNCGRAISYETNNNSDANRIIYNTTGNLRNKPVSASNSFSSATNLIEKSKWSVMQWTGSLQNGATRTIDTTKHYTYNSSVKFTGDMSHVALSPGNIKVEPGETYTFMANIQIENTLYDGKVFLRATAGSEVKTSTDLMITNNEWQMLTVTITVPQGVTNVNIELVSRYLCGTFYVDAVQFVKGGQASYFNLIPDSDFTASSRYLGGANWTATCPSNEYEYGSYGLRMEGSYLEERYFTQTINVSGLANEKFVFGLSSKAECYDIGLDSVYGVKITFVYSGGDVCTRELLIDRDKYNRWQYLVTEVFSTMAFDQVRIELHYDLYEGDAYFNKLFLYRNCDFGRKYTYNDDGNISQINYGKNNSITVAYSNADISSVITRKGGTIDSRNTYTYDSNHNVLTCTDKNNDVTTYTYPSSGNKGLPISVSVSHSGLTSTVNYTYTSDYNHLTSVTDAAGSITSYTYDPVTELVSYVTDPKGNNIYYEYDQTGSVATSISSDDMDEGDYFNGPVIVDLGYDNAFRLTGISICNDEMFYDLSYDSYGRSGSVSCADYGVLKEYSYNSDNTLSDVNYGNGNNVHYVYNEKKEIASVIYDDNTEIDYLYTDRGQLAEVYDEDNQFTTTYSYNDEGQIVGSSRSDGKSVSYKYDSSNRVTGYAITVGNYVELKQRFDYNGRNAPRQVYYNYNSDHIEYSYDSLGRMTCATNLVYSQEFDVCYSYKTNGNNQTGYVDTIDYLIDYSEDDKMIPSLSYDYDENGNIIAVYENGEQVISYTYDKLNRLVLECNSLLDYSFNFEYTNHGDILFKRRSRFRGFNYFDYGTYVNSYSYDDYDWMSLLTDFRTKSIEYDENGNPVLYRGYTMTWQRGRQLASATNANYDISYKYDYNGIRTEKTVNGVITEYYYEGSTLLRQKTGNDIIYFIYDGFGLPYGFIYNGTTYFYLKNLQGDIIGIYDNHYNVVVRYNYNAWGMLFSITGSLASTIGEINPLRYRGYYYDTETSLYYLQSRYYDPETCRFISADAYIVAGNYLTGSNMFVYCMDNPVMYSDPSGEEPEYSPTQLVAQMILMSFCVSALLDHLDYNTVVEIANLSVDIGLDMFEFISMSSDILNGNDEDYYSIAAEHKKRGTTNPANKDKHQKGRKRAKTDKKGGEKGDIRRPKDRSNKRPNINSNTMVVVATATAIVATGVTLAVVVPELIIPATAVILV